jgi:FkbM family methyltransferase
MLGYRDPIFIRRNTSDRFIVRQVFRDDEYGSVDLAGPIHRFVDAGANIGCATYYLLHRYPDAVAEVIEPDADNLAVCQRNLAVFGERVHLHGKGVWPRTAPLRVVRPPTGTAMESTIRVVECLPGEKPDVEGVSLDDLARQGDRSPFDLVKMDIEGAETPILEASPRWLDSTRNLMIELHGPEAHRVFQQVIKRYRAERIATVGDVTVCTGLHRREGTPVGTG